jgi:prolyl-tRNA synthetase
MSASYLDEAGQSRTIVMGCYGIGVSRLVAATVEQNNDADGVLWPMSIAPYQVHVVQVGGEPEVVEAVARLERELEAAGVEVLIDDREERPGVKFKDADLVGIPLRLTVGKKALDQGGAELKARRERDAKKAELVPLDAVVATVKQRIASGA